MWQFNDNSDVEPGTETSQQRFDRLPKCYRERQLCCIENHSIEDS